MLDNILNLEGVAILNKKQQLSINGGSSCAYYNGVTGEVTSHLTSQGAQGMLSNSSDHWCCASCSSASWYNDICSGSGYGHPCLDELE